MQQIPREQVSRRFQALPQVLQDAIFSDHTTDVILKYCTLRDISPKQTYTVGALLAQVLLGYLRPETFAFEIQKETGIDALKATQVAHDIDTEIFSGVRLELKKLYPPTIQTPTVQTQGFTPRESGMEQKPRPYVVQIPERFKKTTDNSKLITHNEGAAQPVIQETKEELGIRNQELRIEQQAVAPAAQPLIHDSRAPIQEQKPAPTASPAIPPQNIPPHEAISYKLKVSEGPPMDPIVPLPTFIQSKFKASELGVEAGIKSAAVQTQPETKEKNPVAPSAQDALKNAFGKFTTSSTATGVAQEPVSPYREPVEEQKPTAKVQGKVIDLSKF